MLPSRAETYGMVVTEALARGIPVLASDAGGLPETLGRDPDGRVPGLLVPPGDAAALAAALRGWLDDPAGGPSSGRRARERRAHAARVGGDGTMRSQDVDRRSDGARAAGTLA